MSTLSHLHAGYDGGGGNNEKAETSYRVPRLSRLYSERGSDQWSIRRSLYSLVNPGTLLGSLPVSRCCPLPAQLARRGLNIDVLIVVGGGAVTTTVLTTAEAGGPVFFSTPRDSHAAGSRYCGDFLRKCTLCVRPYATVLPRKRWIIGVSRACRACVFSAELEFQP